MKRFVSFLGLLVLCVTAPITLGVLVCIPAFWKGVDDFFNLHYKNQRLRTALDCEEKARRKAENAADELWRFIVLVAALGKFPQRDDQTEEPGSAVQAETDAQGRREDRSLRDSLRTSAFLN